LSKYLDYIVGRGTVGKLGCTEISPHRCPLDGQGQEQC